MTFLDRRTVRFLLALAAGALLALAFPHAAIGVLAFVALAPLIAAVLRAASWREAFLLGAAGYLVTWLINVPWVIHVMVRYGGLSMPIGIALYLGMALILSLYGGLFAFAVWRMRALPPVAVWFGVPAAWASVEFLRTYALTGFPWNLLATALIDFTPLIVVSSVIGPYGVAFLAMIPATILGWIAATRGLPKMKITGAVAAAALVVCWLGAGLLMLRSIDPGAGRPFRAAMLQPNITQEMRWEADTTLRIFTEMMEMTESAAAQGAETIVWPESTVPLTFLRADFYREAVEEIAARTGADIILGSVAEDEEDSDKVWNAAYVVTAGRVKGRYDKMHLVPFGEYVPLRKMLFFAKKLVRYVGEFQFGTNDRPLPGAHNYGPAICYEVVFPRLTARQVGNGADVLVTITNDAWFAVTAAPRQHLNMARLRAVEADRWLLRAATTGISAAVDPAGRIVGEIPIGGKGILMAQPTARQSRTPYVRFGDWFAWMAVIAAVVAVIRPRGGHDRKRQMSSRA
jgi:apolipoprotein N-acyltransferase